MDGRGLGSSDGCRDGCRDGDVAVTIARVHELLDGPVVAEGWRESDTALASHVMELHRAESRVAAAQVRFLGEAIRRGLPVEAGARNGGTWLRGLVPVSPGLAAARSQLAERLTDADLEPTATSFAGGALSASHAGVIARTMTAVEALPGPVPAPIIEQAQATLLRAAENLDPAQLGLAAKRLLHALDPDAHERLAQDEDLQSESREAYLVQERRDMWILRGLLPPVAGAQLATALDVLAKPCPAADGRPDRRTGRQRLADAIAALAETSLAARPDGPGSLPTRSGAPTRLLLTGGLATLTADLTDRQDLRGQVPGVLDTGRPGGWDISALTLQTMACGSEVVPTLIDDDGQPLDVGLTRYPFPPKIRRAIELRDRHCTWPGCLAPPAHCDGHHLIAFDPGRTSKGNGALLCGRHHRHVHRHGLVGRLVDGHVHSPDSRTLLSEGTLRANTLFQALERDLRDLAFDYLRRTARPREPDADDAA